MKFLLALIGTLLLALVAVIGVAIRLTFIVGAAMLAVAAIVMVLRAMGVAV